MIFRTDRKRLPWRVGELARPDRRRAAQERRPIPPRRARRPADRAGLRPRRQDALRGELPRRRRPGRRRRRGQARAGRSPWAAPRRRRWPAAARSCSTTPTRSFNQWYSCNTCHSDGHTNGLDFDTLNDGRQDLQHLPPPEPQEGADAPPRHPDRALDLARLADQPRRRDGRVVHQEHARPQAAGGRRQGPGGVPRHARLPQEPLPQPTAASRRPPSAARRSSARPRPAATPATAAPSSPTARSTSPASKSPTTPTAATTPPRSAASTTRTRTSTTAGPRPSARPSTGPHSPETVAGLGRTHRRRSSTT